jgi:3-hydroxyacyl-[acyl-carrier-protein] dehydratase
MNDALAALPHGPSFRFLDEILDLEPGRRLTGRRVLRREEAFFEGHFPGQPLFPGVLMIEAVAQAAGVAAQSDPDIAPLPDLRLTAVRQCKIHGTAPPDSTLIIQASVQGRMGNLVQATGTVSLENGPLLAEAQVVLSGG